jgi:hypothetical protein
MTRFGTGDRLCGKIRCWGEPIAHSNHPLPLRNAGAITSCNRLVLYPVSADKRCQFLRHQKE